MDITTIIFGTFLLILVICFGFYILKGSPTHCNICGTKLEEYDYSLYCPNWVNHGSKFVDYHCKKHVGIKIRVNKKTGIIPTCPICEKRMVVNRSKKK